MTSVVCTWKHSPTARTRVSSVCPSSKISGSAFSFVVSFAHLCEGPSLLASFLCRYLFLNFFVETKWRKIHSQSEEKPLRPIKTLPRGKVGRMLSRPSSSIEMMVFVRSDNCLLLQFQWGNVLNAWCAQLLVFPGKSTLHVGVPIFYRQVHALDWWSVRKIKICRRGFLESCSAQNHQTLHLVAKSFSLQKTARDHNCREKCKWVPVHRKVFKLTKRRCVKGSLILGGIQEWRDYNFLRGSERGFGVVIAMAKVSRGQSSAAATKALLGLALFSVLLLIFLVFGLIAMPTISRAAIDDEAVVELKLPSRRWVGLFKIMHN